MNEIYRRSLGNTVDEDALRHEIEAGVSGHDTSKNYEEPSFSRSVVDIQNDLSSLYISEHILELELQFHMLEEQMAELAEVHPKCTWHVGRILSNHLDQLKEEGHAVDAEMYVEADLLAEEIVQANLDMSEQEQVEVAETMVAMIRAEYQYRQVAYAA